MNRREWLFALGAALASPLSQAQQPGRIFRVGWLGLLPLNLVSNFFDEFEQGMRDHGYAVGKNLVIEFAIADGKIERLPGLARELVAKNVEVIVVGTNPNTVAAKAATQTIPIVFAVGTDVIGQGFVKSLAKPGGNITGLTWDVGGGPVSKAIELLKEIAPRTTRLAVLYEPPYHTFYREAVEDAASRLRLHLIWIDAIDDFGRSFSEAVRQRANAVYVLAGPRMFGRRAELAALAAKHRLPATYVNTEYVDAGGLMAYAPNVALNFRDAARYVDKILKGAKPGDLPVEQPRKIDFVINQRTAKSLGLTISQSVLLRADRGIE